MTEKTERSGPRSASELVEQKLKSLGKSAPPVSSGEAPPEAEPMMPAGMPTGNELDMLRTIMFGSMQRDLDRRLKAMGENIDALSEMITERTDQTSHDADARVTTLQQETESRLAALQNNTEGRLSSLESGTESRFAALQSEFEERARRQAGEQSAAVAGARGELGARLEQILGELRGQIRSLSDESRQRDDAIRAEIIGLLKALEESKVSRAALGDLLAEMGQRLKGEKK